MKKLVFLIAILSLLIFGGTAIADSFYIAKKDKTHKVKKEKKKKKGPNQKAYEHANPNAKFKRYNDYTPKEKEKIKKKTWGEMTTDEQGAISDKYKKNKEKLEEFKRNLKSLGEIQKE